MATRLKTVEYGFPGSDASIPAAATTELITNQPIYIPETSGRVIKSAVALVHYRDNNTTAQTITSWSADMIFDADASTITNKTLGNQMTNSGEHQAFTVAFDLTTTFATHFTGSTRNWSFAAGANITCKVYSIKLIITYQYEDSAATTRLKTVRIPLASLTGNIAANTATTLDTIPALDTFLPEVSKVYRSMFVELHVNDSSTATTGQTIGFALDSAAMTNYTIAQNQNSATLQIFIWNVMGMTTNATHAAKVQSNLASMFANAGGFLIVTYEYDHAASTAIMNSVIVAIDDIPGYLAQSGEVNRMIRDIPIMEPGPITMVNSAYWFTFNSIGDRTISIRRPFANYDTTTAYTGYFHRAGSVTCGGFSIVHRIDPLGIALNRGENRFMLDVYTTANTAITNGSAVLVLNYTSGKHADGDGAHNHTVIALMREQTINGNIQDSTFTPGIPEPGYWLTGYSILCYYIMGASAANGITLSAQYDQFESDNPYGWFELYAGIFAGDNERLNALTFMRARAQFKRHPGDPAKGRVSLETARKYRFHSPAACSVCMLAYVTYHSMKWSVAGTLTGAADPEGLVVEVAREDTDEVIFTGTVAADGTFAVPVYDNTVQYYVQAQSGSKAGRSIASLAA